MAVHWSASMASSVREAWVVYVSKIRLGRDFVCHTPTATAAAARTAVCGRRGGGGGGGGFDIALRAGRKSIKHR
jgi:hypothetical protein